MASHDRRRALPPGLLNELLQYEPETGKLVWRVDFGNHQAGTAAAYHVGNSQRLYVNLGGVSYSAHVLIWIMVTGQMPINEIDHIDRNAQNNRWSNLREVARRENQLNTEKYKNNKSGFRGVHRRGDRWRAIISVDGKNRHLGDFDTPEQAAAAWQAAVRCEETSTA